MRKLNWFILMLIPLCGCGGPSIELVERHLPTTDTERQAVITHVERILANRQSLDKDAISAAYWGAQQALCRPTLWEWRRDGFYGGFTGRWRYTDEVKTDGGAQ